MSGTMKSQSQEDMITYQATISLMKANLCSVLNSEM